MANMNLYIDETGIKLLLEFINNCEETAYIVKIGKNQWIAKDKLFSIPAPNIFYIWHKNSGFNPSTKLFNRDPYKGWKGPKGADSRLPYYGPGEPALYLFEYIPCCEQKNILKIGWIGNYYKSIGKPAPAVTEHWWRKLREYVKKNSTKIEQEDAWSFQSTK